MLGGSLLEHGALTEEALARASDALLVVSLQGTTWADAAAWRANDTLARLVIAGLSASSDAPRGFNAVVQTNLVGTFLMCREVYRAYMCEHGGSIVNITMVFSNGFPKMAHSAAARAGVTALTRTLASEWGERGGS